MLTQKLYKTGNSVAVTIPKEYLEELNLRNGSKVIVEKQGQKLVVTPKKELITKSVDAKFAKIVDEFMDEHKDVLQALSQK